MLQSGRRGLFVYFSGSPTSADLVKFSGQKVDILLVNDTAETYQVRFDNGIEAEVTAQEIFDGEGEETEGP